MDLLAQLELNGCLRTTPRTSRRLQRLLAEGKIVRLLPGTYVAAGKENNQSVRALALAAHDPSLVLVGDTAAALHYREGRWPQVLQFTSPRHWRRVKRDWFRATQGIINPSYVIKQPVPHVTPGVALLQDVGGDAIGRLQNALRMGIVTPGQLAGSVEAFSAKPGNEARRRLVEKVLTNAWSIPELQLHRLLTKAHFKGWVANFRTKARGRVYYIDVAFPEALVGVEVDSFDYHSDFGAFQDDRERHNNLVAAGWRMLHITPEQIDDDPGLVKGWIAQTMRDALGRVDDDRGLSLGQMSTVQP